MTDLPVTDGAVTDGAVTGQAAATTTPDQQAGPTAPASADEGTPSGGPARRWWLLITAGVLAVALLVAIGVLGYQLRQAQQEQDAREDALRYARQSALNLTSIDVADLEADIEQILDGATGEFEDDFRQRSDNLRQVLTSNKVASVGEVKEAALVRIDEDSATALVVVDAVVRNTQNPNGGQTTYRMKLDLERQGDQWLTSMLEFVG